MSALVRCCLCVSVLMVSSGVHAQNAADRTTEARGLYDAGAVAFGDGRFEDALSRWTEAYEISQLNALLYNIGTAHDRLGHPREALAKYQAFLAAQPEADNRNYVTRRIAVLEEQVAVLDAQDAQDTQDTQDAQDAQDTQDAQDAQDTPDEITPPDGTEEVIDAPSDSGGANVPAIVVTAAGGAMLVAGLVTGIAASSRYSSLETDCPGGICAAENQGDIDGLRRLTLSTDVLLAVGGVATIAGVIWLIVGGGSDDDTQAVQVTVGPQSIGLAGRF